MGRSVVFTDEKTFNHDGPDGLQYYWHDLRREPEAFSKRVQGGRYVTVWRAISFDWPIDLVGINRNTDSVLFSNSTALLGGE